MQVVARDKLSGKTGDSISPSETLKRMILMRTLGYVSNPVSQNSISEMFHQTNLLAGVKGEEMFISNDAAL